MFSVIYADPAWAFRNEKTGGNHTSGAGQQYPVMPLPAITALPVAPVASHLCALFLWCPTALKYSHGPVVANAWGFPDYRTTIYWNKDRLGMGFWYRNQVEELLVFTRGDHPPFRCQLPNIVTAPREEHSRKPEAFRRLIEQSTGMALKARNLELFARKTVPGWTTMGYAVNDGADLRTTLRQHYLAGES
jgi:N6-adenosine-specific RNA methylase IME4